MQFHVTTLLDYFIVRWRKQETICPVMSFLWISCNYELLSLCLSSIHVINLPKSWHRNKSSCAWTCCTIESNVSGRPTLHTCLRACLQVEKKHLSLHLPPHPSSSKCVTRACMRDRSVSRVVAPRARSRAVSRGENDDVMRKLSRIIRV